MLTKKKQSDYLTPREESSGSLERPLCFQRWSYGSGTVGGWYLHEEIA